MLTLHQLTVFAVVADEMSIGRAASRLNVSQPAVSASMAALQRELGVELITRNGRGIELTAAGATLVSYAGHLVGLVDEAVAATRATHQHRTRAIRVGASSSVVTHVLAPILAGQRERRPGLEFEVVVANRPRLWNQLANHEVDVVVTTQPPATQTFVSLATRHNEFVVVAKPGAVWAGRLDQVTWLMREEGSTTRSASDAVLAQLGIEPSVLEIGSDDAIKGSIEAGLGVGVLPDDVARDSIRQRNLVLIRTSATPMPAPWHLTVRRGDVDAPLREFVTDIVSAGGGFQWKPEGRVAVAP